MEDSRWERYGALGGVVFVVFDVVVAVLGGEPRATDASRSEVVSYFADNGAAIEAGPSWIVGIGVLSAAGFVGSAVLGATGSDAASGTVGIAGFALWCVGILGVSYQMWSDLRIDATVPA